MFRTTPTFSGPGKLPPQFKTRAPVGKNLKKYSNIPRVGRPANIPLFANKPTPITQMAANTPAFRGPAKLPSNFMKNIPLLGQVESRNPRANAFNQPLKRPFKRPVKRRVKRKTPNK